MQIGESGKRCDANAATATLYLMRTSLGVNYDGGHWFHVAENFMAQHSMLRESKRQSDKMNVFYCFDKAGFWKDLNGFTKLLILLGTLSETSSGVLTAHFMDCGSSLSAWQATTVGDAFTISNLAASLGGTRDHLHGPGITRFSHSTVGDKVNDSSQQQLRITENSSPSKLTYPQSLFSLGASPCVQYQGTVGGNWPALDRGHWFPNKGDISSFRSKLSVICPLNSTRGDPYRSKKAFKMVIYQRDLNRKIANLEETLKLLRSQFSENQWEIQVVMHDSDRSPCELAAILHHTNVLLTPHGFQSMLLMFLPPSAILFEVFPYKYFKTGYARFATEYGVSYNSVMSPPTSWHTHLLLALVDTNTCMAYKQCRGYSRSADVIFTENAAAVLRTTVDNNSAAQKQEQ